MRLGQNDADAIRRERQMAGASDTQESWKRDCLAKSDYCAWAASLCPDNFYRKYLETLAVEWKKAANKPPDEPDSKVSKDG
jgi:hypothetical protein